MAMFTETSSPVQEQQKGQPPFLVDQQRLSLSKRVSALFGFLYFLKHKGVCSTPARPFLMKILARLGAFILSASLKTSGSCLPRKLSWA